MSNRAFKLGGIGGTTKCCCTTCTATVRARGCNTNTDNAETLTIEVWDSTDTTLIDSITTSTGTLVATIPGTGTYHVHVTGSSRFDDYNQSQTLTCSATTTVTLAVKSGYHCACLNSLPLCQWPLADTLTLADSGGHSWTMTWSSATNGWLGTLVVGGTTYTGFFGGTSYCSSTFVAGIGDSGGNGCHSTAFTVVCPQSGLLVTVTVEAPSGTGPPGGCAATFPVNWTIIE